jgi:hypothetical protein
MVTDATTFQAITCQALRQRLRGHCWRKSRIGWRGAACPPGRCHWLAGAGRRRPGSWPSSVGGLPDPPIQGARCWIGWCAGCAAHSGHRDQPIRPIVITLRACAEECLAGSAGRLSPLPLTVVPSHFSRAFVKHSLPCWLPASRPWCWLVPGVLDSDGDVRIDGPVTTDGDDSWLRSWL